MKTKKLLLTTVLFGLSCFVVEIKAQIPNAGLENWSIDGNNLETPDNWGATWTLDGISNPLTYVTKTTDAKTGSYAMKLTSVTGTVTEAMCGANPNNLDPGDGFSFAQRPSKMNFHYKFNYNGNDGGFVSVVLQKTDGTFIGTGDFTISNNVSSYTLAEADISYFSNAVPDVARIDVYVGSDSDGSQNTGGSVLFIDDFSFAGAVGINDLLAHENNASVYPNPSNGTFTIELNAALYPLSKWREVGGEVKIYNVLGEVVLQSEIRNPKSEISSKGWEKGIYFVNLVSDGKVIAEEKVAVE